MSVGAYSRPTGLDCLPYMNKSALEIQNLVDVLYEVRKWKWSRTPGSWTNISIFSNDILLAIRQKGKS